MTRSTPAERRPDRAGARRFRRHRRAGADPLPLRGVGRLREQYPAFWSELYGGHWVITRFDAIRHALQEPTTFSNESTIVSDPNPSYTFIPTFLDPPEHGKYRTLYNARFSPGMVTRVTPAAREAANRYIDAFIDDGRCEFMTAFADPFPTDVFLNAINLPAADTPKFVRWVHAVFGGLSGQEQEAGVDAQAEMRDYFKSMYDRRRTDRRTSRSTSSPICCPPRSTASRSPRTTCSTWRSCSCWPASTPPRANSATTSTTSRPIPRIGAGSSRIRR